MGEMLRKIKILESSEPELKVCICYGNAKKEDLFEIMGDQRRLNRFAQIDE